MLWNGKRKKSNLMIKLRIFKVKLNNLNCLQLKGKLIKLVVIPKKIRSKLIYFFLEEYFRLLIETAKELKIKKSEYELQLTEK